MKALFPEEFNSLVSEKVINEIKEKILSSSKRFFNYSSSYFRLLFPRHFSELNITEEDLKRLRDEIHQAKEEKKWFNLSNRLKAYRILTADRVELTDQGIQIYDSSGFKQQKQKRPERKTF